MGREDRRAYKHQLNNVLTDAHPVTSGRKVERTWSKLQAKAKPHFDDQGRPILERQVDGHVVSIGATAENLLRGSAPPQLVRELIEARLQSELPTRPSRTVSEEEVARDWKLLEQTSPGYDLPLTARAAARAQSMRTAHKIGFRGEDFDGRRPRPSGVAVDLGGVSPTAVVAVLAGAGAPPLARAVVRVVAVAAAFATAVAASPAEVVAAS
jgi:hypothetical protein